MRVLLIEDDRMLGEGLSEALRDAGLSVDWVRDGDDAGHALGLDEHAIVLLDLNLPVKSGLDILANLRRRGSKVPILVITARDGMDDRVAGLDLGADDYLVKPFAVRELLARMRALLRRQGGHASSMIGDDEVALDLASHEVRFEGNSIVLPAREFALMQALLERPGAILSRSKLEERIYGWGEEVESNAVEVLIYSIRKKLGKDVIRNLRGAGWMAGGGRR